MTYGVVHVCKVLILSIVYPSTMYLPFKNPTFDRTKTTVINVPPPKKNTAVYVSFENCVSDIKPQPIIVNILHTICQRHDIA